MKEATELAIKEGFMGIALWKIKEQFRAGCIRQNGQITGPISQLHDMPELAVNELGYILAGGEDMKSPWHRLRHYPREKK